MNDRPGQGRRVASGPSAFSGRPTGLGTSAARLADAAQAPADTRPAEAAPDAARPDPLVPHEVVPGEPGSGDARGRLIGFLAGRVAPDGRLLDACESRILESALFLRLLQAEDTGPGEQQALTAYLTMAEPVDEGSAIIRAAALGHPDPARADRFRATFTHSTGERKQVLLATVFALFDLAPMADLPVVPYGGQALWTELILCASNILGAHARGRSDPEDQAFLAGRLATGTLLGRPWQGNVLAHLIALHALRTFEPKGALLGTGLAAVSGTRRPDGGVPFVGSQDVYLTAMAGIALAACGERPDVVTRMADWIASAQLPDGAWGYCTETVQTDVDDTSRCVEFLRAVDPGRYQAVITAAERYLTGMAGADGGFPTYLAGHPSEPDMTAGAVVALSEGWDRHADVLGAAVEYLLGQGRDDGTYERSWTLSESSVICHVLDALHRVPGDVADDRVGQAVDASLRRLRQTQNDDGGWGRRPGDPSDVLSTAQALTALAGDRPSAALRRGEGWLRARQGSDGSFPSIPDQAGPRPHPYDYPTLAAIHTLNAFNALNTVAGLPDDSDSGEGRRLPDFYCPFPSAAHADGDELDRGSVAWMRHYGLGAGDAERDRLARVGVGHFAARVAPRARADLRQILSDLTMWIYAFDDEYCDEGPLRDRPGELAEATSRIHRCGDVVEDAVYDDDRYGMSLRDLRTRLWKAASPAESDRFIEAMRGYFEVETARASFVARKERPGLDAFTLISLRSGGALALAGLAGSLNCGDAPPPALLHDRSAQAVTEIASTIATWNNGIISIAKERERTPDGFNLLDAIREETGCGDTEGVERMMALMDRVTTLFIRMRDRLRLRRPDLTHYLSGLEHYIGGSLDWALTSDRYVYLDGQGGSPAFEPGGRRLTPRDDSTDPPPIPSIAWWWRHDPGPRFRS
ncbi:prenyltransferase/squalene oxidase repeat-containing protein [Spongiactinospora sp. 9N601]|uniref:terpene synthase family protein n=1 Tax=Spongiactinospora sp. 9N601 TaxID=3375149 RepID=UPI0037B1C37B